MSPSRPATAEERLASAYAEMWEHPAGRIVIEDVFVRSGLFQRAAPPIIEAEIVWREGARSIGVYILEMLQLNAAHMTGLALRPRDPEPESLSEWDVLDGPALPILEPNHAADE
jgi:hypothetical protein